MKPLVLTLFLLGFISPLAYSQNSLNGFIEKALQSSPLILEQKNNLKLASLDSALFRASHKTHISSQNEGLYYPIINGYGFDEVITNGQQVGALISFDRQVLFKGQFNANMNSIEINRNVVENNLRIAEKDVIRLITDRYLTSYGDFLQWQYNREILNLLAEEDSVLQLLVKSNIYKQNDYLLFLANIKRQSLEVKNAMIQYKSDLMELRYQSGIRDTAMVNLAKPALNVKLLPENQNSIFFRQYSLDSMSLKNQVDLVIADYRPQLKLHADAGYLSSFVLTPYKNFGGGIGMSLFIPIYDGRGLQYKEDKIQVMQDNLMQRKLFFKNQYDLQTMQLFGLMNDLGNQLTEISSQKVFYNQLMDAEKKLLSIGQLDILQYFAVLQNYIDLRNQETINLIKVLMLTNEINYLAN
jgi:outer membrane protein TolC